MREKSNRMIDINKITIDGLNPASTEMKNKSFYSHNKKRTQLRAVQFDNQIVIELKAMDRHSTIISAMNSLLQLITRT